MRSLRRRTAHLGGCRAQGRRCRFRAHVAARRARQRARIVTRCCRRSCSNCCAHGGGSVGGATCCCREVAYSRPRSDRAAVGEPALPRCPCRCPGRGYVATHAAPELHHPPPRARCRYSRDSHTSGPCQLDTTLSPARLGVADFWMMVSMASPALFTSAHWTTRFAVSPNSK